MTNEEVREEIANIKKIPDRGERVKWLILLQKYQVMKLEERTPEKKD